MFGICTTVTKAWLEHHIAHVLDQIHQLSAQEIRQLKQFNLTDED